jgi:hypothetical protein
MEQIFHLKLILELHLYLIYHVYMYTNMIKLQ